MPTQFIRPSIRGFWLTRRNRCLQCHRPIEDLHVTRWCSAECEDYWVQDSL